MKSSKNKFTFADIPHLDGMYYVGILTKYLRFDTKKSDFLMLFFVVLGEKVDRFQIRQSSI